MSVLPHLWTHWRRGDPFEFRRGLTFRQRWNRLKAHIKCPKAIVLCDDPMCIVWYIDEMQERYGDYDWFGVGVA